MDNQLTAPFHWLDLDLIDSMPYEAIAQWAGAARGKNPTAFDALITWLQDDAQWTPQQLADNRKILMDGVIARFLAQNARLRARLTQLSETNPPVFGALSRFDEELFGHPYDSHLQDAVARVFKDFSAILDPAVRALIAGTPTGPAGVNTVAVYGYINYLKDCDASVQWPLFMPYVVKDQQQGFTMDSFEYVTMPPMRFIGRECENDERPQLFAALDALAQHNSPLAHDALLMHHYGLGVDVGPWHGVWGRFMNPDCPVPEGFLCFDFLPNQTPGHGFPFVSQFARAQFSGDLDAMHRREGFDGNGLYDVTRNQILAQDVRIPYPEKYWTAELFSEGFAVPGNIYLFSAIP